VYLSISQKFHQSFVSSQNRRCSRGEEHMWFKVMRGGKLQHQLRDRYYVTHLPVPPKPLENTLE
jgi:hypothetical protein